MKQHSIDQIAAWAKSWNMKGYEHLYPENREKARQYAIKESNIRKRDNEQSNNSGQRFT